VPEDRRHLVPDIELFERYKKRAVPVEQPEIVDRQGKRERIDAQGAKGGAPSVDFSIEAMSRGFTIAGNARNPASA
jgi:hypothetical protein